MTPLHLFLIMVVNAAWAFNFIAGKVGVGHFPPILFTSLRFFLLVALLFPFLRWPTGQWRHLLAVGMTMGVLHFAFMFTGLAHGENLSAMAIAVQLHVPMAALLAVVFLKERFGWRRAAGIAIAFLGVLVIGFDPIVFEFWAGLVLILFAAFFMSVSNIFVRSMRDIGAFNMQAWLGIIAAPILLALSFFVEDGQWQSVVDADWLEWGAVAYSTIGASLVGHGLVYYLLKRYPVSQVTPLLLLTPVFAVAFGVFIWGDVLTWRLVLGGVLTIGGVAFITLRETRAAK